MTDLFRAIEEENAFLRGKIEFFNTKLVEREGELEQLKQRINDVSSLLRQMQGEEHRFPSFQARSSIRKRREQRCITLAGHLNLEVENDGSTQKMVALNIWLATRNRFVDKVVGGYMRQRDHVLVIQQYELVKQSISLGILPDIIISGADDFGLDDPNHREFFRFLEQVFTKAQESESWQRELYIITLSSIAPTQTSIIIEHHNYTIRHEFISKLRGLKVTISEIRYFLEMRRCQKDVMKAEHTATLRSMEEVALIVLELRQYRKTGLLTVLSEDQTARIRWAFNLFFFQGKLVKAEHTLASSGTFPDDESEQGIEEIFTISPLNSEYDLNPPEQSFFFELHDYAILRELESSVQ